MRPGVVSWPEWVAENLWLVRFLIFESSAVFSHERDDALGYTLERLLRADIEVSSHKSRRNALRTIVAFALKDWQRYQIVRPEDPAHPRSPDLHSISVGAYQGHLDDLKASFDSLTEDQRRAITLDAEGYDGDEIARRMGMTRANVHQLQCRGRRRLRALRDAA